MMTRVLCGRPEFDVAPRRNVGRPGPRGQGSLERALRPSHYALSSARSVVTGSQRNWSYLDTDSVASGMLANAQTMTGPKGPPCSSARLRRMPD